MATAGMIAMGSKQLESWVGEFGREYTDRNSLTLAELDERFLEDFGISAHDLFSEMLNGLRISSALEVGCNIGSKLALLHDLGIGRLTGIEPLGYAIDKGKKPYPFVTFKQGTVFDLPFEDESFDLVFTAGVLIHIEPTELEKAMMEIVRVARRYVLGYEYFATKLEAKVYRGREDLLWKQDFKKAYLKLSSGLRVIHSRRLKHQRKADQGLLSEIFILKK
jgi:pseudaminic acid biosynthesis-associated methylase